MMQVLIDDNPGNGGEDRVVVMRLCSCTTGMSYRSELVPLPASYEVSSRSSQCEGPVCGRSVRQLSNVSNKMHIGMEITNLEIDKIKRMRIIYRSV